MGVYGAKPLVDSDAESTVAKWQVDIDIESNESTIMLDSGESSGPDESNSLP
eukprot:CAMPEP_0195103764 /NCGR_PEP_ID=MMETSP0448-20130528/72704_1 /TAXON_ID=66468 /ORGANISM="Heterocapsa triquestra, Strain CCMP 448" /LENGTH=51 /DNA_ID=CAMNT_0040139499 /DNA_START=121 /DNA_END=272 /DNA_ORIENTATION=+